MNKPLQKLRRFFSRSKKFNATANPDALSAAYEDDDGASRLSGAFVVVLLLHIVALVGVFAFARMKDSRASKMPSATAAATAETPTKSTPAPAARPAAQHSVAPAPVAPTAEVTPSVTAAALTHNDTRTVEPTHLVLAKGERLHIVKTGENLTKISGLYNVSVPEIVKANGLKSENDVRAGQELRIPEAGKNPAKVAAETRTKTPETAAPGTYIVRKNDSLIKIANTLGVKYADLVKLNDIKDPKKLQEGQKLKVPKKG